MADKDSETNIFSKQLEGAIAFINALDTEGKKYLDGDRFIEAITFLDQINPDILNQVAGVDPLTGGQYTFDAFCQTVPQMSDMEKGLFLLNMDHIFNGQIRALNNAEWRNKTAHSYAAATTLATGRLQQQYSDSTVDIDALVGMATSIKAEVNEALDTLNSSIQAKIAYGVVPPEPEDLCHGLAPDAYQKGLDGIMTDIQKGI